MWQQRQYFEQSNVLDVTIQCQVNMASKNVAEFSNLYSPPPSHTHQGFYQGTPSAFSSCAKPHQDSSHMTMFYGVDNVTPVKPNIDNINSQTYLNEMLSNGPNPCSYSVVESKYGQQSRNSLNVLDSDHLSSCMNDSGYGSPTISLQQSVPYPEASPDLIRSRDIELSSRFDTLQQQEYGYSCRMDSSECSFGKTLVQCDDNVGFSDSVMEPTSPVRVKSSEDLNEEMELAMRERVVTQRLFALRARDTDLANELESYYQSQTSMVDLERHNVLCQMAYDKGSSESINVYYNRKLMTVLEFVENKLSKLEKCSKEKSAKRQVKSPKKSRLLPKHAVKSLESWYQENLENPYPSREVTLTMASEGDITVEQIRKWFANKRNRSRNSKLKAGVEKESE